MSTRVAMLVFGDVTHDNRVRREAATLGRLGYQVHVVSVPRGELPEGDHGVTHHGIVMPAAPDAGRGRERRDDVRALGERYVNSKGSTAAAAAGARLAAARAGLRLETTLKRVRRARRRVRTDRHVAAVTSKLQYAHAVLPLLEELQPDVVHAHDLKTLHAAARYAKRRRVPLVYDAHEFETHSVATVDGLDRAIARVFERSGIRRAAAVVTVADAIADELARLYGVARPWVVLNTPSLQTLAAPPALSLRDACGLGSDDRLMTYVGLVHPSRGTDHVVRALSELPESFHFAILGPRRPARDDTLGELAALLGVGHRLHLLPPVPGEQVPATLATSDISIVPGLPVCLSYELAMANKLFESVMAGIPIAVSNGHRSMAEFVRDNQLGVVFDAGDASSIARAVQDAARELPAGLADPERLDTLRRRYSWERQEETLAQVYDVVAQSR